MPIKAENHCHHTLVWLRFETRHHEQKIKSQSISKLSLPPELFADLSYFSAERPHTLKDYGGTQKALVYMGYIYEQITYEQLKWRNAKIINSFHVFVNNIVL